MVVVGGSGNLMSMRGGFVFRVIVRGNLAGGRLFGLPCSSYHIYNILFFSNMWPLAAAATTTTTNLSIC